MAKPPETPSAAAPQFFLPLVFQDANGLIHFTILKTGGVGEPAICVAQGTKRFSDNRTITVPGATKDDVIYKGLEHNARSAAHFSFIAEA